MKRILSNFLCIILLLSISPLFSGVINNSYAYEALSELPDAVGIMASSYKITLDAALPNDNYTLKYEDEAGVMGDYEEICSIKPAEEYNGFVKENIAPQGATKIGVYNSKGERVGSIALAEAFKANLGSKLYSFGAISDVHIGISTSENDFKNALTFFENDSDVEFTAITGDFTHSASEAQLDKYKEIVDNYSTKPVYAISGNHELNASFAPLSKESLKPWTGQDLYYSVEKGDDVYIMLGLSENSSTTPFAAEELQWLYETLEANRNKRCFVFMHLFNHEAGSGDAGKLYAETDKLDNAQGRVFFSLLSHYKNVIYFHGHSHQKFEAQEIFSMNTYDNIFGYHSVHIPSITKPKEVTQSAVIDDFAGSQGYVVDVYENEVVLRGRDFVSGKFLPIAQYSLDTTASAIEEGAYYDKTGLIFNENTNVLKSGNSWYKGVTDKSTITSVSIVNNYEGQFDEEWIADVAEIGNIKAYINGTQLYISEKKGVAANENSGYMFSGFSSLKQIDGLETIATDNITNMNYMFEGCTSMTSIDMSMVAGRTIYAGAAFRGCTKLTDIVFENCRVESFSEVFQNCKSIKKIDLTKLEFEQNIPMISTFSGCSRLEKVLLPQNCSIGNNLYMFDGCSSLKEFAIPAGTKTIYSHILYGCLSLETITLPISIESIAEDAFYGCKSLKTVNNYSQLQIEKGNKSYGYIGYYADTVNNISAPEAEKI